MLAEATSLWLRPSEDVAKLMVAYRTLVEVTELFDFNVIEGEQP